jgi:hypothetical protein
LGDRAGSGEIRPVTLPARAVDEVLVRTHFSAISRGTELQVFAGRVPNDQRQAMRAPFQDGEFPGRVKYDLNVGVVQAGPAEAVGGLPEALGSAPDGSLPGTLFTPDDPAALASALTRWRRDEPYRQQLRTAAAQRRNTLPRWAHTARERASALDDTSPP